MQATNAATKTKRKTLSDTAIKNAKPAEKSYKLVDVHGLHLLVQPNGTKLWRFRFWLHDKEGLLALGRYPDVDLATARDRRDAARKLVASGINPVHAQQQAKQEAAQRALEADTGTFSAVTASWRTTTDRDLKAASVRQRERELNNDLLPALGARQVASITRLELSALLEAVAKRAPETARNLRTHLFAIFEHAIAKGLVTANPVPPRAIFGKRRQTNHPSMPSGRVGSFLRAVDASSAEPATRTAMLLVILNAARKAEVICGAWSEIDLKAGTWLLPGERMKGGRDHVVPLSRQALKLLQDLRADTPESQKLIFPNRRDRNRPMANRSLNALLERIGFDDDATVHGFRSLFSTRYNELGVNPDVIERCLAHVHGNAVRAAYNRAAYMDQRRELLQQWADWLDEQREKAAP